MDLYSNLIKFDIVEQWINFIYSTSLIDYDLSITKENIASNQYDDEVRGLSHSWGHHGERMMQTIWN